MKAEGTMETRVSGLRKEVIISHNRQTIMIGERINPTGKKKLAQVLKSGDLRFIVEEAHAQIIEGADILDVNVGIPEIDEAALLTETIELLMSEVDAPLCFDSVNPVALEAALKAYRGKPLINSVSGEEKSMKTILPLVKEYNTAVIALPMDEKGIPQSTEKRMEISYKIVEQAGLLGIPAEDIIIDCLALSVATDSKAGLVALETTRRIRDDLGLNVTVGASNISFGMPERQVIDAGFLSLAVLSGLTCPIVDPGKMGPAILAADLLLGRDRYGSRYLKNHRLRKKSGKSTEV
jgi:5-methyltetrahydrofolate--homocysteine methyltransferase